MQHRRSRKQEWLAAESRQIPVTLSFGPDRLSVEGTGPAPFTIAYTDISKLSYELASHHRVKEGAIVMLASLGAGGIVMLTKSKSHWLYIDYTDAAAATNKTAIFKLDKKEYKQILEVAGARTHRDIVHLPPSKSQAA